MSPDRRRTSVVEPLDDFLLDRSTGRGEPSGNYRRGLERSVTAFLDWCRDSTGPEPTFEDLDPSVFRRYARDLKRGDSTIFDVDRLRGDAPTRGTVLTYYANLSAYLGWAVDEGYLPENPAQADRATDPLPEDDGRRSGDEQAWTDAHRRQLTAHVDDSVRETLAEVDPDDGPASGDRWRLVQAYRDRALAYCFAYSGIRVGELLRDGNDDRRIGVTWRDLSLADSRLTVLSKRSGETWSDRSLPAQTVGPLERLGSTLDPPSEDWPVFPSLHRPSLYRRLRSAMEDAGVSTGTVAARVGSDPTFALMREFGVVPPSMSSAGARSLMQRLTESAGIEVDDRHGYLTPHGGRRGIGEVVVRQQGFAAAARFLDDTERMVRDRYSHIEAGELAAVVTDAIDSQEREARSDRS